MPADNRVSASLTAADKTAITAAITTIRQKLPFLVNLTDEERKGMLKLGDKSMAFEEKCFGHMTAHPELVPSFVNMSELAKDRALRADLSDIWRALGQIHQAVDDTMMLAGHEAFIAELPFYQNVSQAAKMGVADAKVIYDDSSTRFPGRSRTSNAAQPAKAA